MRKYICALSIVTAFLVQNAHANTTYTFSGHMCQPDDINSTIWDYTSNGVTNTDTNPTELNAWCPIGGIESTTVDLDGAQVHYYDGHSQLEISCTLYIRYAQAWITPEI